MLASLFLRWIGKDTQRGVEEMNHALQARAEEDVPATRLQAAKRLRETRKLHLANDDLEERKPVGARAPSRHTATASPTGTGVPPSLAAVVRDLDADTYLESFLVAAVAAVLGIRLGLELTGYPQLGGGGLHIAHMLWGGLAMLIAITAMLAFLGKRVKSAAAIVGGLGFGAFVDELGKFITSDNNYFFQPTIGILYVLFVVLFLVFRQIERHRPPTDQELLVNATEMLKQAIIDGARTDEINRALALLARSRLRTNTANAIRESLLHAGLTHRGTPSLPTKVTLAVRQGYDWLIAWRWFQRAIVLVFVLNAIVTLLGALAAVIVVAIMDPLGILAAGNIVFPAAASTVASVAVSVAASVAVSVLTIIGVTRFPRSRLDAYRWFKRAVLVSIFLVQVFQFFQSQLAALSGLAFDLVLLSGLNAMLRAEHGREEAELVGRPN